MKTTFKHVSALLLTGAIAFAAEPEHNLLKNGSFEDQGDNVGSAVFWGGDGYSPGIRTDEKASEGKYSVCFLGDGKNNLELAQSLNFDELLRECGSNLQDARLDVSCDVYVESFTQGALRPIHFILVDADGKAHYLQGRIAEMKIKQWITVKYTLDLHQYVGMKSITFYILGYKDGEKFFVGKFYVDNVKIRLDRK